jgi:F-box protein 3
MCTRVCVCVCARARVRAVRQRLDAEEYIAGALVADRSDPTHEISHGISLYHRSAPAFTTTVTRGVRAVAVSVYAPEMGSFIYSVRLRLLRPDEPGCLTEQDRGFSTCQLSTRHWILRQANGSNESVDGSGVVGKYPLLREGGSYRDDAQDRRCRLNSGVPPEMVAPGPGVDADEFIYQSMTGRGETVAFGGALRFVPGSLRAPTGDAFDVVVKHIELNSEPEYIY